MKSYSRKTMGLGLVAGLVMTGLVGVTSMTASGQSTSGPRVIGDLVLEVPGGSTRIGTVKFFAAVNGAVDTAGTPTAIQTITATASCPTLQFTGADLLGIRAEPGIAVVPNNGIGVIADSSNCGSNAAVVRGEGLRLTVRDEYFRTSLQLGARAEVDVDDASLTVFRDNAGGDLVINGTAVTPALVSGLNTRTVTDFTDSLLVSSSSTNANRGIYLRGATFRLVERNAPPVASFSVSTNTPLAAVFTDTSTDPDAGDSIVSRSWAFTGGNPATTTGTSATATYQKAGSYPVTLTVTDTRGATASRTENVTILFDEGVPCSSDKPQQQGGPGDIAKTATFLRGENGSYGGPDATCTEVGVIIEFIKDNTATLGFDESSVFWDNSFKGVDGSTQLVEATVTIDWAPIPVAKATVPTQIDFDGPNGLGGFIDAPWCLSFSKAVAPAPLGGKETVTFTATLPPYSGLGANTNGTAPWCLASSVQSVGATAPIPPGGPLFVNRTEVFYGAGDPLTRTIR